MNKRVLSVVALISLIGVSWVFLYRTVTSSGLDLDPYVVLGQGAARETSKALRGSGRIVIVDASFGEFKILAPTTSAQIRAFKKAIRGTDLKVVAVEEASIDPPSMSRTGIFMRPKELSKLLAKHSGADALVLFVGLANREDVVATRSSNGKPQIMMVGNFDPFYRNLLAARAIHLAIAPRVQGDSQTPLSHESQDEFERQHLVLTPENVKEAP